MLSFVVMPRVSCVATDREKHRALGVDAMVPDVIWDPIDNGGTRSATRVVPELQTVVSRDVMPAVPNATDAFIVASIDPPHDRVLTVPSWFMDAVAESSISISSGFDSGAT